MRTVPICLFPGEAFSARPANGSPFGRAGTRSVTERVSPLYFTERFILSELYDILVETPPAKVILLALDQGLWDCERSLAELSALCEAIEYWGLSQRKFYSFLKEGPYDFLAFYNTRRLILRVSFERYLWRNPTIWEALKNNGKKGQG